MGRVLKILSLAVILFLVYMGITLMTKSCNKSKDNVTEKLVNQNTDKKADIFDDEEFFAEDDSSGAAQDVNYKELDQTIADTKNELKEKKTTPVEEPVATVKENNTKTVSNKPEAPIKSTPKSNAPEVKKPTEVKTTPSQTKESLSGTGDFTVVAGNYLLEANADQMVKKLKSNGFGKAEKVVFDLSEFFTVIAGRYSNYESASKTVSSLKAKGIDCYIHRKQ